VLAIQLASLSLEFLEKTPGLSAPTGYSSTDWTNNSTEMVISGSVTDINTALEGLSISQSGATISLMVTRWDGTFSDADLAIEASELGKTTILQQTSLMVHKASNDNIKALLKLIE
jgi:hypothetical protein